MCFFHHSKEMWSWTLAERPVASNAAVALLYQDAMPSWMTAEDLISAGYNIEENYKPYISSEELQDTHETCQQFFIRNFFITQCALQATEEAGGNVLLIGHAATLDTCSRQLVGKEPRPVNELMAIVRKVGGDPHFKDRGLSPACLVRMNALKAAKCKMKKAIVLKYMAMGWTICLRSNKY